MTAAIDVIRAAAADLGAVYRRLYEYRTLPLDSWAVVPRSGALNSRLLLAIAGAFGAAYDEYAARYRSAYFTIIPELERAANAGAQLTLAAERTELAALRRRLRARGMADQLHAAAQRIGRRAGGHGSHRKDLEAAVAEKGSPDGSWSAGRLFEFHQTIDANQRSRIAAAVAAEVRELTAERPALDPREMTAATNREDIAALLIVLFAHPKGVAILAAYDRSPVAGTELADELIAEASEACRDFAAELKDDPEDIWRYGPLVVIGAQQMGIADVDGLPEYVVDLGQVLGRSTAETVIGHLGLVLFCVGLVFTGPVGAAVLGAADLALTGAGGALAYLRERQQETAATASGFRAPDERLATAGGYGETGLAGAAALVSALGLLGPARQLLKVRPRAPGTLGGAAKPGLELAPKADAAALTDKQLAKAIEKSGADKMLTARGIASSGRATDTSDALRHSGAGDISPQKMAASGRKVKPDEIVLGSGAPREFAPEALDNARGTAGRLGGSDQPPVVGPLDYNTIPEASLRGEIPSGTPARTGSDLLDEAAIAARHEGFVAHPDLGDIDRANKPGKQSSRVITREEQLHGINLRWQAIRAGTPTPELDAWAKRQLAVGGPDPLIPSIVVDAVEADHIVAIELIKQFPGFAQLDIASQLRVLNTPENFMAVSKRVNGARGSMPFKKWKGFDGHTIPQPIQEKMIRLEADLAALLQRRIDDALRKQSEVRGLLKPVPVLPVPERLPIPTGVGQVIRPALVQEDKPVAETAVQPTP